MAADEDTVRERHFGIEKADLVQQLNGRAALALHHCVKFEKIDRRMNLHADPDLPSDDSSFLQKLRRARINVAGKQHRDHPAIARAGEFFGKVNSCFQAFAPSLVIPVVFQAACTIVEEANVLIAWPGAAANTDLIHHIDVPLRFSTRATDIKSRGHPTLEDVNQRESLADINVFEMGVMSPFARWTAVSQIVRRKKIGLR